MITVSLSINSVEHGLSIIRELKQSGYKVGIDFDFEYKRPVTDMHWEEEFPRRIIFYFHKEELSSWFLIKYK